MYTTVRSFVRSFIHACMHAYTHTHTSGCTFKRRYCGYVSLRKYLQAGSNRVLCKDVRSFSMIGTWPCLPHSPRHWRSPTLHRTAVLGLRRPIELLEALGRRLVAWLSSRHLAMVDSSCLWLITSTLRGLCGPLYATHRSG